MDIDSWYYSNRGIKSSTLDACGILRGSDYASWEFAGARKVRQNFSGEGRDRVMYFEGTPRKEVWPTMRNNGLPFIITEGETDAMRLAQEWGDRPGCICALGGINFYDHTTFQDMTEVYFVFDNDGDDSEYMNEAQKAVEASWHKIKKLVPHAKRIYLPTLYKDVCKYFDVYDVDHFQELMKAATKPRYVFEALDLTKAAEPPQWLWHNKMARGDIVMFQAEPGMGKSMVAAGLTIALVEDRGEYLGLPIMMDAKVLVIDEENPEDVIRSRYSRMGITHKGLGRLRVLHEQGVRLDRNPEALHTEAEAFKPDFIVLDSLTRLHTEDENNAGAVSRLFNESIHPLARKLGATVLVLHHVNKSQTGSSFIRTRGSSDINGVIDAGFDMVEHQFRDGTAKCLVMYKNRRGPSNSKLYMKFHDQADDVLRVQKLIDESKVL